MISLKAPHNNLMPYTQQSILNTVKNNQLSEDIKSSLVDLPLYFQTPVIT